MRLEKLIDKEVAAHCDLQEQQQTFLEPENWLPNSPILSCVLFCLGGVATDGVLVYSHTISDTDQLKCMLIDCWAQLSQETLNRAIDQLPKRLMMVIKAKGAHVEFRLD